MLLEKETGNRAPRIQGSTKTFLILPCPILIVTDNKVNAKLSKLQTLVLTYGSINQANISSVDVMSKCEENIEWGVVKRELATEARTIACSTIAQNSCPGTYAYCEWIQVGQEWTI